RAGQPELARRAATSRHRATRSRERRSHILLARRCARGRSAYRRVVAGSGGSRSAMRKVLMVAYHFPPLAGSSGIQRTLRFAQQLPEFGWQPIVLTTHPRAYERTSDDLLREVPTDLPVARAFALDTARQLAIGGRYLGWLARPDRWMTWRFAAVGAGLSLVREHAPHAIWSTYPI